MRQESDRSEKSAREWRELFVGIGDQIRREAARTVGIAEDADWAAIGRTTDERARRTIARAVGAGDEADWEELGRRIEEATLTQIAKVVGSDEQAAWSAIRQGISARVEGLFRDLVGKSRGEPSADQEQSSSDKPFHID